MSALKLLIHQFRRHWVWLKWVAAIAILTWLYRSNKEAFDQIEWLALDKGMLLLGGVLMMLGFLITFTRWYYLVRAQELPFRYSDALRLGFIGVLFNYIAPGSAGGDIIKALLIAKEQPERKAVAVATVLLDRILGLIALFLVGSAASLWFLPLPAIGQLQAISLLLWVGSVVGVLSLFLMLHTPLAKTALVAWTFKLPAVGGIFEELQKGILLYHKRKSVLWMSVGLSVVGHFCILTVFYSASVALHSGPAAPDYRGHLFLIPSAELAGVLIPTPAGIGALEGAVQGVYGIWNEMVSSEATLAAAHAAGFSTALIFRATNMLTALIGAGFYFASRREIDEVLEQEEHVLDEETLDPETAKSDEPPKPEQQTT